MDQEQTPHCPTCHNHPPFSSVPGSILTDPLRARWSPTPEQIFILESIFNSGLINPPKQEVGRIRMLLKRFGDAVDANIFYWFQNRRSKSRRKIRQLMASAAASAVVANNCNQVMMMDNILPQHSGSDLGFGGNSNFSEYLFGGSSQVPSFGLGLPPSSSPSSFPTSYGDGCNIQSNNEMDNLLTMFGQMGNNEANQDLYEQNSLNVASILYPSDQISNLHYPQGSTTVFINGVPTEVTTGGIDVKTTFGEGLILVHSSGVPLPTDQYGFLMDSLQFGESYFLVPRQI